MVVRRVEAVFSDEAQRRKERAASDRERRVVDPGRAEIPGPVKTRQDVGAANSVPPAIDGTLRSGRTDPLLRTARADSLGATAGGLPQDVAAQTTATMARAAARADILKALIMT